VERLGELGLHVFPFLEAGGSEIWSRRAAEVFAKNPQLVVRAKAEMLALCC
jgi:hypothetical protein